MILLRFFTHSFAFSSRLYLYVDFSVLRPAALSFSISLACLFSSFYPLILPGYTSHKVFFIFAQHPLTTRTILTSTTHIHTLSVNSHPLPQLSIIPTLTSTPSYASPH
ncbi:hypothetical protein QCA50_003104 [Cerrena zonata]|uniref:Uncharacterized protein n=1 Tax=Cerrena zonata TaxID=2478898 RepID=A0AAW0GVN5_9APHY